MIFQNKNKQEKEIKLFESTTPILLKNTEAQAEIINLTTARELNHLKKRMWKFYHK